MTPVRISLDDRDQNQAIKKPRSRKRRSSRTFHSAISQTMVQPQARPKKGRSGRKTERSRFRARQERDERRERQPIARRISWRKVGLRLPGILLLVPLVTLIVYASVDARFFVYGANVDGNKYIAAEKIYAAADVHEQHIFWIEPKVVQERISTLPGIKSVRVRIGLPARVIIQVQEREPALVWRTDTDWWLDHDGMILPYGEREATVGNTIFVIDQSNRQMQGEVRLQPSEMVNWVQRLADALPGVTIFWYQADRGLNYTQVANGHKYQVYVGDGKDLTHKIQAVQAMDSFLLSNGIRPSYVDVRWPDLPVYGTETGAQVDDNP